jgi:hypothetical protein
MTAGLSTENSAPSTLSNVKANGVLSSRTDDLSGLDYTNPKLPLQDSDSPFPLYVVGPATERSLGGVVEESRSRSFSHASTNTNTNINDETSTSATKIAPHPRLPHRLRRSPRPFHSAALQHPALPSRIYILRGSAPTVYSACGAGTESVENCLGRRRERRDGEVGQ